MRLIFLISIPKIDMLVMKHLVVLPSGRWKGGVSYSHEVWVSIYFNHWQFSDSSPWSMDLSFRPSHLHPFYFSRHRNEVGCVRQWFTVKHNWLDFSKVCFSEILSTERTLNPHVLFSLVAIDIQQSTNIWSIFSFLKTFPSFCFNVVFLFF